MRPTKPDIIDVPRYIETRPEVVEKLIYIEKPQPAPEIIEKTVKEYLPQET